MPRRHSVLALALLVAVSASAHAQPAPNAVSPTDETILAVQGGQVRLVTVASGLVHPWSIALLPGDRSMLVAERNGRVRLIQNDALAAEPVWSAEGVAAGNELKWLALHPRFESNRLVYLSYPKAGERGTTLIPLSIYFKDGRAKLELGVAKGKQQHDKRDSIKRKEQDRELRRATTRRQ